MEDNRFIEILGYKIFRNSKSEALEEIKRFKKVNIISGNPEVIYNALNNKVLEKNFKSNNSFIIPDGIGIKIAAKLLKTEIKEKIAGIELMMDIISYCEENDKSIYLIGAKDDTLKSCVANLVVKYPNLNIAGYHNGYFNEEKEAEIIKDIKSKSPECIFIAMGSPRQDIFITKYMEELPSKVFMGVGGSFDVIGEKISRAPRWMIDLGLEWLYRVAKEPYRIARLVSIPKFLYMVLKSKRSMEE